MNQEDAGDLVASLYDSLFPCLVRYAAHLCGSVPVAEETVQDTFLLLYRSIRSGRRVENPRAWAFTVVRRALARNDREPLLGRVPHVSLDCLDAQLVRGAPAALPPAVEAADVDRLLLVLTSREREVVLLRAASLRYREIGDELGISLKSVYTMLVRALRKLQRVREEERAGRGPSSHVERQPRRSLQ